MTRTEQQAVIRTYLLPIRSIDSPTGIFCLLSHNQIVEILGPRHVQAIPHSPAYLKGVLLYRDRLLPVINLDEFFNTKPSAGQRRPRQLVVVRTGVFDQETGEPHKVAVATYSGVRIAKVSAHELNTAFKDQEAPSPLRHSGIVRGFFQHPSYAVAVCDFSPVVLGTLGERWRGQDQ